MGAIILAAGKGTRMQSERAKVLHDICDLPMIRYVVETALSAVDDVTVVIGHQADAVRKALADYPTIRFALQEEQLGTGHAVLIALDNLPENIEKVAILCGDTPLLKKRTLVSLIEKHMDASACVTVLGTVLNDPYGYGRIVIQGEAAVTEIVEESDADEAQRKISMINSGTYCIDIDFLKKALPEVGCDNAQQEFYLTDVVALAYRKGTPALLVEATDSLEVLGVNTQEDLRQAEEIVTRAVHAGCENPLDFYRFR